MSDKEFTRLARTYGDTVFRVAFSFLKNRADAEDVTQTVLLRLFQEKKPFASEEHVKYWLIRVAANESKRLLRCAWRKKTEPLEDYAETLSLPSREHSDLFDAVMALPAKYRIVVYLLLRGLLGGGDGPASGPQPFHGADPADAGQGHAVRTIKGGLL